MTVPLFTVDTSEKSNWFFIIWNLIELLGLNLQVLLHVQQWHNYITSTPYGDVPALQYFLLLTSLNKKFSCGLIMHTMHSKLMIVQYLFYWLFACTAGSPFRWFCSLFPVFFFLSHNLHWPRSFYCQTQTCECLWNDPQWLEWMLINWKRPSICFHNPNSIFLSSDEWVDANIYNTCSKQSHAIQGYCIVILTVTICVKSLACNYKIRWHTAIEDRQEVFMVRPHVDK